MKGEGMKEIKTVTAEVMEMEAEEMLQEQIREYEQTVLEGIYNV